MSQRIHAKDERWENNGHTMVLKNTFLEVVDDGSPLSDAGGSGMVRACSDSVLYEGTSRKRQEDEEAGGMLGAEAADVEFELTGLSDTETDPGTKEGKKSLPLLCYSHIQDDLLSGQSSPLGGEDDIALTPSPGGLNWPGAEALEVNDAKDDEHSTENQPDPLPDVLPPQPRSADAANPSKEDLSRLAAEVARLAQENELLRQRFLDKETPTAPRPTEMWMSVPPGAIVGAIPMPVGSVNCYQGSGVQNCRQEREQWGPVSPGQQGLLGQTQQLASCQEEAAGAQPRRSRRRGWHADGVQDADDGSHSQVSAPQRNQAAGRGSRGRAVEGYMRATECDLPPEQCTTVMLRNLPNNYSRAMLTSMLDDEGFAGKYNFLYLPIDFQSCACLGYAFVNLVDASVVPKFWTKFSGYSSWVLPSKKVCGVSWSGPHQGLEAHVDRYRNSPVMHASVPDEYKPVVFENGIRVPFPEPSKVPRPPRVRNHSDFKVHSACGGNQHHKQNKASSSEHGRKPAAVGALTPGSVSWS